MQMYAFGSMPHLGGVELGDGGGIGVVHEH